MRWLHGALAALPALVSALASTDSYMDADLPQSGYLPSHNLVPNVVGSSSFRNLWEWQSPNAQELWLAKPLVYTPSGGSELLITSSEMNILRIFDAKTGSLLHQRQLQLPFSAGDSNCGDVPNWIGITGTPIIDPATDILYVMSKGYREGTTSGTANGIYKMYAVYIPSLEDAPGFPTLIDGNNAENDRARYFVGGVALQRPSLAEVNGHIVAGFGSHCGRWNYTGYLVSVSKQPGVGVTSIWATETPPGAPSPQPLDLEVEQGGKAGIWQSGMGLATTGNAVYFVTGNGQGMHNGNVPASGRLPMSTLSHCTVRMELSPEGKFSQIDYFQPYDYTSLNAGDRDVGSSGFALLDGSVFRGTGVDRIGVIAGKRGRAYVLNANDLGGFRNGANGIDNTLQTIELGGAVYGGFGSYPHEGGFMYVTTVGGPLTAFRIGHDAAGKPVFSIAGQSTWTSAGRVGVGQMTVTSDNGRPGSGIVWITDVTVGLMAFRAVPEDGVMVEIPLPSGLRGANKFQRPVFGDGRVYFQATSNRLYCLGTPVNEAISCSDVDFGSVELGSQTTATVSCHANTTVSAITGCSVSNPSFICDDSTLPSGSVSAGSSFTFDVTWDLENRGTGVVPGFVSSSLSLDLDAPAEYGQVSVVALEGTVVSQGPFLHATSMQIPFGNIVLFPDALEHLDASAVLQNAGNGTLTITGVAYQLADGSLANITSSGSLGSGFSSTEFPASGTTISAGERLSISTRFVGTVVGDYSSLVTVWSDGGSLTLNFTAGVRAPPVARFEVADGEGGWTSLEPDYHFSFGDVRAGSSVETQIRVCNDGGNSMTITISKPPDNPQLFATNPSHDLAEGLQVEPNDCAPGTVAVRASPLQPNHPSQDLRAMWSLTTDGLNATTEVDSGLHDVVFEARIISSQLGPLLEDGMSRYQYVGCFSDTSMGRNLQTQVNTAEMQATNTIQQCQSACYERGFIFAGVQYRRECWCGGPPNNIRYPQTWTDPSENRCTFSCTGDDSQACGGDGGYMSLYADHTAFDIEAFLDSIRDGTDPPGVTTTATTATTATTSSTTTTAPGTTITTGTTSTTSTTAGPIGTSPASPLNPQQPAMVNDEWEYAGCFHDLVDNVRTLGSAVSASDEMTLERCGDFCDNNGSPYNYFGLTYGRECFCGWSIDEDALRAPEADCYNSCAGSPYGICGGWRKISAFRHINQNSPPAGPEHVQQAGDYQWVGCQTEATTGRALSGKSYASDDMTVDSCAAFCEEDDFQHMGVEYGRECYCGNSANAGSVPAPDGECNMLCRGNSLQFCGAGSRLDFYTLVPGSGSATTSTISASTPSAISSEISSDIVSASSSSEAVISETSEAISSSEPTSSEAVSSSEEVVSSTSPLPSWTETSSVPASTESSSIAEEISSSAVSSSVDIISSSVPAPVVTSSIEESSAFSSEFSSSIFEESTSSVEFSSSVSESSSIETSSLASSSSVVVETSSLIESSSLASESSSAASSTSSVEASISSSIEESSSSPIEVSSSSSVEVSSSELPISSPISVSSDTIPSVSATTSSEDLSTSVWSSSSVTSSSSGPTATPTNGYYYVGCFQDVSRGSALPHMLSNRSVTPELCIDVAHEWASRGPNPTAAPAYLAIEYHHECHTGNSFDFQGSAVTSLVGTRACKDYCYGSVVTTATGGTTFVTTMTDNYCGGPHMFDLYATELPVEFPTTGGPVTTRTTGTPRA